MAAVSRDEFKVHKLNGKGLQAAHEMSLKFSELLTWIESVALSTPELTITKRKLEEACFYAKKSMAMKPENQENPDPAVTPTAVMG